MDWCGPGYEPLASSCECCDEPAVSMKYAKFLDELSFSVRSFPPCTSGHHYQRNGQPMSCEPNAHR
jgi:hypothetical protein